MSDGVQVELDVFEGPLDLLLHLVKKHELQILEIPIAFITEKYLEHLALMQTLNLDVAGEYLLMAATLAYIKSRELLPPDPNQPALTEDGELDESDIDPRGELIKRLLEYQKYKEAARELGERPVVGRNVWTRRAPVVGVEPAEAELLPIGVHKLIEAFEGVLKKARIKLAHDVVVDRISITDKIHALTDRLAAENELPFEACFGIDPSKPEQEVELTRYDVVITFLAILEMTRLHLLELRQVQDRGSILLCRPASVADGGTAALPSGPLPEDDYK